MENKFIVETENVRLDVFLSEKLKQLTRSYIKRLIDEGKVLVNGKIKKAGYSLKLNDEVVISFEEQKQLEAAPQDISLDIVYEDSDLLVINKPQGLVVHPCSTTKDGTLVNALLFHIKDLSGINGVLRPGIVHRLDKDTSGLMLVAKNDFSHKCLSNQLKDKTLNREYLALVRGKIKEDFSVEGFIGRNKNNRLQMCLTSEDSGKYSYTDFIVEKNYKNYTLLRCKLKTGRTHQIRVHLKSKGHTIVGDKLYGGEDKSIKTNGQLLTAVKISFIHPRSQEKKTFEIPLPKYFDDILKKLK